MLAEENRGEVLTCLPTSADDRDCLSKIFVELGRKVWRRPLNGQEVDALVQVSAHAGRTLGDVYEGLQYGVAALLQSPDFLMRPETGSWDEGGVLVYKDYEMASRLSFLLWNSVPDDELLDAAERGELDTPEGIDGQVQRLLADPRAHDGLRAWTIDLFHLDELDGIQKDPSVFIYMNEDFETAAVEETVRTVDHLVFEQEADLRDLMTTRTTFVDRTLAALYDVAAPDRDGFGEVELPEDGPRAGLLGQASLLAVNAHPSSSSATLRGKFVRGTLLCETLDPPPAGVDTSIPEATPDAPTLRDRIQVHLQAPACAGCHERMDPIGLGMEQFDGMGRYRTTEADTTIDPTGDLDGVAFDDALGLALAVRDHENFVPCLTEQVARYALGREIHPEDEPAMDWLTERFETYDHRLKPLWMELAVSPLFRQVGEAP